jgi:hypothetical protein
MIPAELSGHAAEIIQIGEQLESERMAVFAERTTLHAAIGNARRQRKVLVWSIGFHFFGFVAWFVAAFTVWGRFH